MRKLFRLLRLQLKMRLASEDTKQILRLWLSDRSSWVCDSYWYIHPPARLAIWMANEAYALHIQIDCESNGSSRVLDPYSGRRIDPRWLQRHILYKTLKNEKRSVSQSIFENIGN